MENKKHIEPLSAKIRNKLGPFWTLVSIAKELKTWPKSKQEKIIDLLADTAVTCENVQNDLLELVDKTIMPDEYILCAANWYLDFPIVDKDFPEGFCRPKNCDSGMVFSGLRHHNCLYQMVAITGKPQHEMGREIQGFLTNKNRFVGREEGLIIALNANQVKDIDDVRGKRLHSEDLY
ncbi:MAG: hypothetical protein WC979_00225 [Candidatus Pacearchaeota archaeon]|jgi:hypothetical protein|nr:hypothetical protein [Clostridia bacterium]